MVSRIHSRGVRVFYNLGLVLLFMCGVAHSNTLELQKLVASDAAESDQFGRSVSISGDRAIIGARGDGDGGILSGSAYLYQWSSSQWVEQAKLTANDAQAFDAFGASVSISGDHAIVGAPGDSSPVGGSASGSAYIYQWNGQQWVEQVKLTASDAAAYDNFGGAVSINGDYVVVGAAGNDDEGSFSGSAYVFQWNGSQWSEEAKLTASNATASDFFGGSVSAGVDLVVVGATGSDDGVTDSGVAYVYHRNNGQWVEQTKLTASDAASGDNFGHTVAISGNRVIVGSPGSGGYVYELTGSTWNEQATLAANAASGSSVSISSDRAIVGATFSFAGSAFVYQWDGSQWQEKAELIASDSANQDFFATSVSISGERAIVGARGDDDGGSNSGSGYVYDATPQLSGNTTLPDATGTETFEWSPGLANVAEWWFYLGSQQGALNYYNSGSLSFSTQSATVSGLPVDGSNVYARLWYRLGGESTWYFIEKTYNAFGLMPSITSPSPGSQLAGEDETFSWSDNGAGAAQYWLEIGSVAGAKDYVNSGNLGAATSLSVSGLPVDGSSTVYVRLWYRVSGGPWLYIDETYTAGTAGAAAPQIISPVAPGPLTDLTGTETFEWNPVGTGTHYWLFAGSVAGDNRYLNTGNLGDTMTATVTGLPTNGSNVWLRLWYRVGGVGNWQYIDEQYTAAGSGPSIVSTSGTGVLTSPTDTFSWIDPIGTVTEWWLYVGSNAGGSDYEDSGNLGASTTYSTTTGNLPTGAVPVYVRLWFKQGGSWEYIDEIFTSAL